MYFLNGMALLDINQQSTKSQVTKPKHVGLYNCYDTSDLSLRHIRAFDRWEFFVPRTRTTMTKFRSFSVAGPSSVRASFLSSKFLPFLSLLKTYLFSWS